MKRCSMLLAIKEMQIKATVIYHFTSIRVAKIIKERTSVDDGMEKLEPSLTDDRIERLYGHFGKQF